MRRLTRAVILGCVAVVVVTAAVVASPRLRHLLQLDQTPETYQVGGRIDTPPDTYRGSPYTVVVFARASCAACQKARLTLAEIVRQADDSGDLNVSLVMPADNRSDGVEYGRQLGLSETRWFPAVMRRLKVRVVPTAVFVDHTGTILAVSEGADEPLRALERLVQTRPPAS